MNGLTYVHGKWAAADASWCDLMDMAQSVHARSDVVDAMLRCLRRCHVEMWPADHWATQRKRWTGPNAKSKVPAFQVSERSLSQSTGLSRQRVRTALRVAEAEGLIVRLAEPMPRGDGRGCVPATYTFSCYLTSKRKCGATPCKESTTAAVNKETRSKRTATKWGTTDGTI